jgi:NAD(P)H-hydrate epimerase
VLSARAAARSGTGLVYCAYPRALGPIMESHLVEPVKIPLAGGEGWFTAAMTGRVLEEAEAMDAVAIGPGLGRRPETGKFLSEIVTRIKAPLLIDADALNLLAEKVELLALRPGPTILTPHPGEAARLLETSIAEVQKNRLETFVAFAREYNVVTVLKGAQTITTEPGGQRWINPTGNSGMAKGGSGDVLTGIVAGLLAQGAPEEVAARLGVFLHGLAGDVAAERHGVRAMLPGDVIEALGEAFKRLQK